MTDDPNPDTGHSFAERLRRAYGGDVDPEIDLDSDRPPGPRADAPKAPDSSGVLSRLESHGARSNRYRMQGEIARGGMGAILEVWDEDLRRKIAMKVALGRGGEGSGSGAANDLDPRVLARFLEEAQVTGQLEHPGIVPVHELGIGADGEVFFTMRLVRGRDLEQVFRLVPDEDEGWTRTRALEVLLKVCDAMAYAHSKGVVHRDLKPANVMVGHFGEVYVMDWGLVRVKGHADRHDPKPQETAQEAPQDSVLIEVDRRADASGRDGGGLYTLDGDVMGTPAYMAPEQARGLLDALDERTDVYSLGAMLYRLLAGHAPYTPPGERRSGADVLRDLLDGRPAALDAHDAPPELIAICEKAMRRTPDARYASMRAFADDLRSFLENRVVGAYETGAVAEARKWVRRNRPLAAALAAGLLALVGGLFAALVQKGRADDNAVLAAEGQTSAERQARIAAEVNAFLNDDLFAAIAPEHAGVDVTVREVLDDASLRLAGRFPDEPLVEAALRTTIGTSYERLGEYEVARGHLERALELRRAALAPGGGEPEELGAALNSVAWIHEQLGQSADALALYDESLALLRAAFGEEDERTLSTRSDRLIALASLARFDDARAEYDELLPLQDRVLGAEHPDVLASLNNFGLFLTETGELGRAETILRDVAERRRRLKGDRHPEALLSIDNLAELLSETGEYAEAEALQLELHTARVTVLGPDHPQVGQGRSNYGALVLKLGRFDEARELLEEARMILLATLGEEHPNTLLAANNLAIAYSDLGRHEDALELRERTLETQRAALGEKHPDTLTSLGNLAMLYRNLGRMDEALRLQRRVIELQREVHGPDHPATLIAVENLGGMLYFIEDYAGSLAHTSQVLEARRRVLGDDHPDVAKTTFNLGMIAQSTGDTALARDTFEDALARFSASTGPDSLGASNCHMQLGSLLIADKEYAPAEAHYLAAIEAKRALAPDDESVGLCFHQMLYCAYMREDYTAAIEHGAETVKVRRAVLGEDAVPTLLSLYLYAKSHLKAQRYAEAEPLALDFHTRCLATLGAEDEYVGHARKLLMQIYEGWGKEDEAARWRD